MTARDLVGVRTELAAGRETAVSLIERSIEAAGTPACRGAFLLPTFDAARDAARRADEDTRRTGTPAPLGGLAVSIKDLFDVAGETTAAASKVLADEAPAATDCPAVARLRAAGAALIGRTNMSEFAFSGLGLNPHYGTPRSPWRADVKGDERIAGGSSSGAAASAATEVAPPDVEPPGTRPP